MVLLSEWLKLSADYTSAEAYLGNAVHPLDLTFVETGFVVQQNRPNPFRGETSIRFQLPETQVVQFQIFDVSGRSIKSIEAEYSAGYHELIVSPSDLNGQGVYYYQVKAGEQMATRKMVMIR